MARWEYPTSRRILMQVVLCLILCGSVGLAALVTRQRRGSTLTPLAGMRYVGPIGARLPRGWILEQENRGSVLFLAAEPAPANQKGRQITIRRYKVDPNVPPEEFLQDSGLLQGTELLEPGGNVAEPVTVAGHAGAMLAVKKPVSFFSIPVGQYETMLCAVSVRPSGIALSLELECAEDADLEENRQVLIDVAGAMDVQDSH